MSSTRKRMKTVAILGGGPAGLMAAEILIKRWSSCRPLRRHAFPGRKFLLAGRGGLNLTHSEPFEQFLANYGTRRPQLEPLLTRLRPAAGRSLGAWSRHRNLRRQFQPGFPGRYENCPHSARLVGAPALFRRDLPLRVTHGSAGAGTIPCASPHLPVKYPFRPMRLCWRWGVVVGRKPVPPVPGSRCWRSAPCQSHPSDPPIAVSMWPGRVTSATVSPVIL